MAMAMAIKLLFSPENEATSIGYAVHEVSGTSESAADRVGSVGWPLGSNVGTAVP